MPKKKEEKKTEKVQVSIKYSHVEGYMLYSDRTTYFVKPAQVRDLVGEGIKSIIEGLGTGFRVDKDKLEAITTSSTHYAR